MTTFEINKEQLVQIVSAAETRKYAEEIELLQERGASSKGVRLRAAATHRCSVLPRVLMFPPQAYRNAFANSVFVLPTILRAFFLFSGASRNSART